MSTGKRLVDLQLGRWLQRRRPGRAAVQKDSQILQILLSEPRGRLRFERVIVEYCIGSVDNAQKFVTYLETTCKLGSSGLISYLQALSHCLEYLRYKGLTVDKVATLITTEVFLARAKQCLRKKRRVEWRAVLSIEHLESRNCRATLADLQKVLPYHQGRFDKVMNLEKGDAVSFLVTALFLKVKGSRPMTYQFSPWLWFVQHSRAASSIRRTSNRGKIRIRFVGFSRLRSSNGEELRRSRATQIERWTAC